MGRVVSMAAFHYYGRERLPEELEMRGIFQKEMNQAAARFSDLSAAMARRRKVPSPS